MLRPVARFLFAGGAWGEWRHALRNVTHHQELTGGGGKRPKGSPIPELPAGTEGSSQEEGGTLDFMRPPPGQPLLLLREVDGGSKAVDSSSGAAKGHQPCSLGREDCIENSSHWPSCLWHGWKWFRRKLSKFRGKLRTPSAPSWLWTFGMLFSRLWKASGSFCYYYRT